MPKESYLPVYSGMPTAQASPSSEPVELMSASAVGAFLDSTPFASLSVTDLTGGLINYVYRIHLLAPFEGNQTVVLKHAQPFWKSVVSNPWGVERQVRERELPGAIP
jgi:5-methylthioribose kinase